MFYIRIRTCVLNNFLLEYDVKNLPWQLNPIAWLVGRWRSEMDGKVRFPTIPTFTYGEQLDITISERPEYGIPSLNYSSHAWGTDKELLHGESGYIAVKHSGYLAMTLTMQNGFVTNEEGRISGNRIYFRMRNIGRLSWSRDLPVLDLRRTFELIDNTTLDQRVRMKTLTKNLQDHAYVRYRKVYP
uniref:THAP4-like heme-binding beta-barrel domain-containing protein n=1 Tax=Romanomermis culicivorax TaxID=13658 RepID=A0A915L493_ROMCU